MLFEVLTVTGGSLLSAIGAYHFGKSRVAPPLPPPEDIIIATPERHQHIRWKKDLLTRITSASRSTTQQAGGNRENTSCTRSGLDCN